MSLEDEINAMNVRVVPHFIDSAAMCLAREEALHEGAVKETKKNGTFAPIIGTYSFRNPSVILGNLQTTDDINVPYCIENGIDITMRKSGGGSVYLSPEEIQYYYILPIPPSPELIRRINLRIQVGLGDLGFSPQLNLINKYHVLRIGDEQSFVFDAQRNRPVYYGEENDLLPVLLHHGTILIDDKDFGHMPAALRAPPKIANKLQTGNMWLRKKQEIQALRLIRVLQNTLPFDSKTFMKDLNSDEVQLAQQLHDNYYGDINKFSNFTDQKGICYIPGRDYDMKKYRHVEAVA